MLMVFSILLTLATPYNCKIVLQFPFPALFLSLREEETFLSRPVKQQQKEAQRKV